MLKAKITVEIEVDQDEISPDWQEALKSSFSTLDGAMVYFSESKGVMKIKKIKIEENKRKK